MYVWGLSSVYSSLRAECSTRFQHGVVGLLVSLCRSGKGKADNSAKAYSDAFAHVVHTLLSRGSGLWLGPDCDGLLNFCDDDVPSKAKPSEQYHTVLPKYVDHSEEGEQALPPQPPTSSQATNGKANKAGNGSKAAGGKSAGKKSVSRGSSAEPAPSSRGGKSKPGSRTQAGMATGVNGLQSFDAAGMPGSSLDHHVDLESCTAGMTLAEHLQGLSAERERQHKLLMDAKHKEKEAEQQVSTLKPNTSCLRMSVLHSFTLRSHDVNLGFCAQGRELGLLGGYWLQLELSKRRHLQAVNDRRESQWAILHTAKAAHNAEVSPAVFTVKSCSTCFSDVIRCC